MFLLLLAVLPSVFLLSYIWRKDTIEKEPPALLIRIFLWGALTVVSAILIGTVMEIFLQERIEPDSLAWLILDNFIMTALVEEGGKYFVLKWKTWKSPEFNYLFDGIVYAVVASLGFATLENILYVMSNDLATALMRAVLSVPGHAMYGVFMGCFYSLAKRYDAAGNRGKCRSYLRRALWVPTLLHGFYDFCLSTGDSALADSFYIFFIALLVFEIVVTVIAYRTVKKFSTEDAPIA